MKALFEALAAVPAGQTVLAGADADWDGPAIRRDIDTLRRQLSDCRVLAVLADNSPAWVIADLAALEAEWTHLPLPTFFSPAQLAYTLALSAADACLSDQPERIEALNIGFHRRGQWNGLTLLQRKIVAAQLPPGTAKISFTSGSTGEPKGVCLSAAGLAATAAAVAARLHDIPVERHLAVLPLALLLENVAGIYAPLLRGATVSVPPLATLGWQGMAGFNPAALHQSVAAHDAHSVILVPELAKAWFLFLAASGQQAPQSLKFVAVGGARVDADLLQRCRALGMPLYQGYGLTECGSVVSLNRPGDDADGVGRPLDHARIRIDADEVCVQTPAFLGYLGEQHSNPADEVRTGDLGHLDAAGHLHLDGRRKNLLITSYGRNISPEWLESLLLAEPAVAQAMVAGESRPWLCALLVPLPGQGEAELDAAVTRVNARLPDYARIGAWLPCPPFALKDGLATGNGRPIRTAIAAHYAAAIESLYAEGETRRVVL